jgi:RNA polymerase-associated protein RTF1
VKPYKINDKMINQAFELKHGKSMRTFNMDKVSNGPFTDVNWAEYRVVVSLMFLILAERVRPAYECL